MNEAMKDAVCAIKTPQQWSYKLSISLFIKEPNGMRNQVCQLQQTRIFHTCKIRNVSEIVYSPPGCTLLTEIADPDLGSLVESTLGENQ